MVVKAETMQEICTLANRQVQELYPNLQAMFIPHSSGTFHEIVETSDHQIMKHAAGKVAMGILEKNNNREQSSFLGMAINHQIKWFGLASSESMLALFNLNMDEFEHPRDLRRAVYHLLWHAIDLVEIRRRPEYVTKFRTGPMIPKRSPMNLARLNLQADVFAAVMSGLQGEENALEILAEKRAIDSIRPVYERRAEDYPFVIALEAAQYAYAELETLKPSRQKYMSYARQLAQEVGRTFDDKSIRQWWGFSEPAQDMAWRNFPKEIILGCAVHTSEDPFVRATGHLVSEITGLIPLSGLQISESYNAFVNQEVNQTLHREMVERAFEEAIARGIMEESGQPLIAAANLQNENLAEGIIMGWCSHAFQAAAKAFESALTTGVSPTQAARLEFEGTKDATTWDTLKKIGNAIIDQKRRGYAVTLGNVAEICSSNPLFAPVLSSIRVTMKDPSYVQKLQAANDLVFKGPSAAPASPAPKTPSPVTPTYSTPASAPTLGGGSAARQKAMLDRMRAAEKAGTSGKAGEEDRVQ